MQLPQSFEQSVPTDYINATRNFKTKIYCQYLRFIATFLDWIGHVQVIWPTQFVMSDTSWQILVVNIF
jgi:hypothetical protein